MVLESRGQKKSREKESLTAVCNFFSLIWHGWSCCQQLVHRLSRVKTTRVAKQDRRSGRAPMGVQSNGGAAPAAATAPPAATSVAAQLPMAPRSLPWPSDKGNSQSAKASHRGSGAADEVAAGAAVNGSAAPAASSPRASASATSPTASATAAEPGAGAPRSDSGTMEMAEL